MSQNQRANVSLMILSVVTTLGALPPSWAQERLALKTPAAGIAFSADSKLLAVSGRAEVVEWDVMTGEKKAERPTKDAGQSRHLAYSADGKILAANNYGSLKINLWDLQRGVELRPIEVAAQSVHGIRMLSDSKTLVVFANPTKGAGTVLHFTNVFTGKTLPVAVGPAGLLAVSPKGTAFAVSALKGDIKVWPSLGAKSFVLKGHEQNVQALAFSPDGTILASASFDDLRMWDVANKNVLAKLAMNVTDFAFSPNGKHLVVRGSGQAPMARAKTETPAPMENAKRLQIWDIATLKEVGWWNGYDGDQRFAIAPDGKTIAVSNDIQENVRLLDYAKLLAGKK